MAGGDRLERGLHPRALLHRERAARMEVAPRGWIVGDGTSPLRIMSSRGASGSAGSAAAKSAFV